MSYETAVRRRVLVSSFSALCVGLAGCASTSDLIAKRFSREHACQADAVEVRQRGGNVYIAQGCGRRAEYVCQRIGGFTGSENADCAERGTLSPAMPPPREPPPDLEHAPNQ